MLPVFQMMAKQMAQSNPMFQRAIKMAEGKSAEELKQVAENLCKHRGISLDEAFEQFKAQMTGTPVNGGMSR